MKNNFEYIKKILKVLTWPIIFIIGQFLINYIFVAIFNVKEKLEYTGTNFLEYIKTREYMLELTDYINSKTLIIVFISMVIFVPLFYKIYKESKNYKQLKNYYTFKLKDAFIPILLGITISLIYNITLFNLNNVKPFTNIFELSQLPIIVQIISSGICGPILEELVFRGVVYNKLRGFNKKMVAMTITGIIFGIIHSNLINAIYAFGVNYILIYVYHKYKSLKAPIITHIFLNTTIILLMPLIIKNYMIFNLYLLIVSIIILIIIKTTIKGDMNAKRKQYR